MTTNIASKNLYELLGNDLELDPNRPADPPTKVIDKPLPRTGKRDAAGDRPRGDAVRTTGTEQRAPRGDNAARREPRADGDRPRGQRGERGGRSRGEGRGEGRGGRGFAGRFTRNGGPRDDRHSHTNVGDNEKQAAAGWGAETDGQAEFADEKAGDAIANAEAKQEAAEADEAVEAEPEDKTKSYDEYLAEQAEKRLGLAAPAVRKANEGSKQKFPEGTAFSRNPAEEEFITAAAGKAKKEKELKQKDMVVLDGQYYAPIESGDSRGGRGGRGGARGGRGRGEGRGRSEGGRGGRGRGDRERGDRGAPRGGEQRGPRGGFNANDSSAFPALGGK